MQEIKTKITYNIKRDSIVTGFERILFERDHNGNLWIGSWNQSPILYKIDETQITRFEFPIGYYLASDNPFDSNPDNVLFGSSNSILYFRDDQFFSLPSPKLANPSPYQILNLGIYTYVIFANTSGRKQIHRWNGTNWEILNCDLEFQNLYNLKQISNDKILVTEGNTEIAYILDLNGKLISEFAPSVAPMKVKINSKTIYLFSGSKLEVRNSDGELKSLLDLYDETMKTYFGSYLEFIDVFIQNESNLVLLLKERNKKISKKYLLNFNLDTLTLTPHPLHEKLNSDLNLLRLEIDNSGDYWFKIYGNHYSESFLTFNAELTI
ncbi:hypothetical protein ND861_09705 [Leptospira sp. 2 VSF19]|uniref:Uncharacterized protein n=1 Tax=Leptospira soteropolitanensis TaxID=2950025 RepID=A0AAW5VCN4_9LEPT|nr:hypothetical protein [Leptospira soteropolitanensis]MCW7492519.1 hypothetical protein [Leptospira soteropolitanensis]MCW7500568.1 hypothetical protein [Leptospira soteropolitanensis]MCW7522762.1 hypothetical protein [Leptospira soteropolitanensis]MCW7526619.1 hypothetical protein [Leptospira soteropolitanensis]MCW7530538.1 hypothetical protein [Leptospira soteropolitanensis]